VHEFGNIPIGEAPDFSAVRGNEAAALSLVENIFGRVEFESFDFAAFENFIRELQLEHLTPEEFLFLGASNQSGPCAGRNALPPQFLWPNIASTAIMLDRIRSVLGTPVRILSCYRSAAYNTCIGGAGGSHHKRFNAIDWTCSVGTVQRWRDAARQVRSSDPRFAGGIGFYPSSRFIHIDTRGSNAEW
jgi:N-acetylmuramoyl-L-alanine amidase